MRPHRLPLRIALLAVLPFLVAGCGSGVTLRPPDAGTVAAPASGAFVPDEILVEFAASADPDRIARGVGARVHGVIEGLNVHILKVSPPAAESVIGALSRNPQVVFAERNGIATTALDPNDPYDGLNGSCYDSSKHGCVTQWAWGKVEAYAAWDGTTGSSSVRIAVVDTGVDNSHPDLPAVVAQKDFINNDSNAEDDNGHGSHVAGTIGALTDNATGVAAANWSVSILAAKVLNASGSGSYSAVASGIRWAADSGARAINLSLGGSIPSNTLKKAVDYAWNKGAVLACAAGNSGTQQKLYPAAYANCIAVAATDENDAKASFSNYGANWVDVAAPGVKILSTMPDSAVYLTTQYGYKQNYDSLNGTSMATPHVAGQAGLVWARGGCSSASCVRNKIESTADAISGTGTYWKWGRVNYRKAVN
jgi:thermitase